MIKVCMLTSVHGPFDSRIFHKEARSLAREGYEVTLVAQHEKDEIVDGIRIASIPRPKNRMDRIARTVWKTYRKAIEINADIYHFHDPELIPVGVLLRVLGYRVLYDVHEDVPRQVLAKYWLPTLVRKPVCWGMSLLEWLAEKLLSGFVTATPSISARFAGEKTITVQNFPILSGVVGPTAMPYAQRLSHFAYVGDISRMRGGREMVEAIDQVLVEDARLSIAGDFQPESFQGEVACLPGWASVNYHGKVSRDQVGHLLEEARAGLVLFLPLPNHMDAQPTKMFEYMSAGIPVIASDFPLWRRIIEGVECGLLVNPSEPKAIAEAMRWILDHPGEAEAMGRRGRQAVERTYNWGTEAKKLIAFYGKLLGEKENVEE
jgi:glycosyltransferase involved in cell wall biosynthesis